MASYSGAPILLSSTRLNMVASIVAYMVWPGDKGGIEGAGIMQRSAYFLHEMYRSTQRTHAA